MTNIDDVIEGLKKVWDAFNSMEHELYADYVFDAIALLKDYGQHLKNDLETLKEEKQRLEHETSVDSFEKWCVESHIMGAATSRGIIYWVDKFKAHIGR